jgi:hypothetical protein
MKAGATVSAGFTWNKQRKEAARLLGTTSLSFAEVADRVGVSVITLKRWREDPEFTAKVKEFEAGDFDDAMRSSHARRADRIRTLSDTANRLLDLFHARSVLEFDSDEETEAYHRNGGRTGLVTARKRSVGSGEYAVIVTDFSFGAAAVKELRETLKSIAVETGQWGNLKVDPANTQIVVTFAERSDGPE